MACCTMSLPLAYCSVSPFMPRERERAPGPSLPVRCGMVGAQAVLAQLHHQFRHALLAASGLELGVQERAAHFRQQLLARARRLAPAV